MKLGPSAATASTRTGTIAPAKILAALWTGFLSLMICASLQDALRNPLIRWWEPVLWEGSSGLAATGWMLIAVRFREAHAPYLDRPMAWFARYLRWLPVVAVTFIAAVYAIRHGVYAILGHHYEHPGWPFIFVYETIRLTLFAGLWLGILFGIDSYGQWQVQRHRLLQTQAALAEARLAQLQGQLRPHFLFNALNTVSALMQTDVPRADRLVAALGDLLRISLRTSEHEMTPLADELRTLELYTTVMRERFRDRVALRWEIDKGLLNTPIPALLLQPLIENVFKHGVERTVTPVRIGIRVRRVLESLDIAVINSGPCLARDTRDGVGLRSCRERLDIIYGDTASLEVRDEADGVVANISIPLAGVR